MYQTFLESQVRCQYENEVSDNVEGYSFVDGRYNFVDKTEKNIDECAAASERIG